LVRRLGGYYQNWSSEEEIPDCATNQTLVSSHIMCAVDITLRETFLYVKKYKYGNREKY